MSSTDIVRERIALKRYSEQYWNELKNKAVEYQRANVNIESLHVVTLVNGLTWTPKQTNINLHPSHRVDYDFIHNELGHSYFVEGDFTFSFIFDKKNHNHTLFIGLNSTEINDRVKTEEEKQTEQKDLGLQ